ncbi:MAG: helix-turn-helix domain-containing protein [Ktedonobacterales bacterium]
MPLPKLPSFGNVRPVPPFGELLYSFRTLRGISIEQLAQASEIVPNALREIERGERPAPSETIVKIFAKELRLDGDEKEQLLDSAEWDSHTLSHILGRKAPALAPARQPALTAGILVFLIADIRGYTSFTQQYGDAAAARLTGAFAEIARAAFERWDGRLVEMRGDEALGVFGSARQAMHAALDLHARCTEAALTHANMPLNIGIGLDVGEATPVDNGYRGAALNRAARLCSVAQAGETLISLGVAYVAPLVDGVQFIERGQEQLKGFAGPTPILAVMPAPESAPGGLLPVPSESDEDQE